MLCKETNTETSPETCYNLLRIKPLDQFPAACHGCLEKIEKELNQDDDEPRPQEETAAPLYQIRLEDSFEKVQQEGIKDRRIFHTLQFINWSKKHADEILGPAPDQEETARPRRLFIDRLFWETATARAATPDDAPGRLIPTDYPF